MTDMIIRQAVDNDFPGILALNAFEEMQTSPLDTEKLRHIDAIAAYHKIVTVNGEIAAFLLAIREQARYKSENYQWFALRYNKFLYVDRIVVGASYAGLGIGSLLYSDLFESARAYAITKILCEYNIEPPNPASKAFHDKFGFKEVGRQHVANGKKLVSLQAAEV